MPLLSVKNLHVGFYEHLEKIELIRGVDLEIDTNEVVALVGGSGGGKTMTGLSVLKLLPYGLNVHEGEIFFQDQNLLEYSESHMQKIRGREISMIFQEPLSAFNPVFSVGSQIEEVLKYHTDLKRHQRKKRVVELLDIVGMQNSQKIAKYYPHELSGGMRQRAMIAIAIAANPKLIIADEPTSNLDVTLQVHIIELFKKLKRELGIAILLITHDLGVVGQLADKVAILFDGKVVEFRSIDEILSNPKHPYTNELLKAVEIKC